MTHPRFPDSLPPANHYLSSKSSTKFLHLFHGTKIVSSVENADQSALPRSASASAKRELRVDGEELTRAPVCLPSSNSPAATGEVHQKRCKVRRNLRQMGSVLSPGSTGCRVFFFLNAELIFLFSLSLCLRRGRPPACMTATGQSRAYPRVHLTQSQAVRVELQAWDMAESFPAEETTTEKKSREIKKKIK
jgi:hypothetical protein